MFNRHAAPSSSRTNGYNYSDEDDGEYDEEEDEYDSEMDDFIDDSDLQELESGEFEETLKWVFWGVLRHFVPIFLSSHVEKHLCSNAERDRKMDYQKTHETQLFY